ASRPGAADGGGRSRRAAVGDGPGTVAGGGEEKRSEPDRSAALEARRRQFISELGVGEVEAEVVTRTAETVEFFEAALASGAPARAIANWLVHDLPREAGDRPLDALPFRGMELGRLAKLS